MNTMESEVQERINDIFEEISKGDKLESGDIEPLEQVRLDEAIKTIAEVISNWRKVNQTQSKEYSIVVEATDEADAYALRRRITDHLQKLDNGDFKGRDISIIQKRNFED